MLALAHHYDELVSSPAGTYRARVYGQPQDGGTWSGWLVFFPVGGGRVIATDRETTQSSLEDLGYWASGLTHVYLHGALERALALQPEAQLARELEDLERIEAAAAARAETLESAASLADADARAAGAARQQTEEALLEAAADSAVIDAAVHERAAAAARADAQAADQALAARRRTRSGQRGGRNRKGNSSKRAWPMAP